MLERTLLVAPWLGLMQAVLQRATAACRQRTLLGKSLSEYQSIRRRLVEMRRCIEQATCLVDAAAQGLRDGPRATSRAAAVAKLFVAEGIGPFMTDALAVCGLEGDDMIARAHADAPTFAALGGGMDLLYSVIAGALLNVG
jgi:alkylation response protein AidB-like acyl-CoA dehydrogenase